MANKTEEVTSTKSKGELEEVDLSKGSQTDTEPKLVNLDNGTQSFEDSSTEKVTEPKLVQGAASMDNSGTDLVKEDWIETPVVVREKRIIDERLGGPGAFDEYLENLKKKSPKKWAIKKEELANRAAKAKEAAKAAKAAKTA